MKNKILSLNFGSHDTSASIMIDGELIAACEEERYNYIKHTREFPSNAIADCLKLAKLRINEIDVIVIPFDPIFAIQENYLKPALKDKKRIGIMIDEIERIRNYFNSEKILRKNLKYDGKIKFYKHHLCHLSSAYYPSGFENSLIMSNDGLGEIESSVWGIGSNGKIKIVHDSNHYPNSLGLIYNAITYYLGWEPNFDEGIIMGLAPYGDYNALIPEKKKSYYNIFSEIIKPSGKLDFIVDQKWMAYFEKRDKWISEKFIEVFGERRKYKDKITQHHKNIAAALQKRLEDIVINQLDYMSKKYKLKNLSIAGGVGLNCSLNGKIVESGLFNKVFVQPASGDSGLSVGGCYLEHFSNNHYQPKKMYNFYKGSKATDEEMLIAIKSSSFKYSKPKDIFSEVAKFLQKGKIVGWFQGSSEFGPRALGNRSILCKPFPKEMKDYINSKVKFREEFRPFAPAILEEKLSDYFQIDQESPHMMIAAKVKKEKINDIPAVIHIDNSSRVQTVTKDSNKRFYKLLQAFYVRTKCPVLLNTSFNIKGQPIINTPIDAVKCFESTKIDILAIGDYLIIK